MDPLDKMIRRLRGIQNQTDGVGPNEGRVLSDAKITVSLALSCGCSFPPGEPMPACEAIWPGLTRECPRHEAYFTVTRVTSRLVQS